MDTAIAVPKLSAEVLGLLGQIEVRDVSVLLHEHAVDAQNGDRLLGVRHVAETNGEDLTVLADAMPRGPQSATDGFDARWVVPDRDAVSLNPVHPGQRHQQRLTSVRRDNCGKPASPPRGHPRRHQHHEQQDSERNPHEGAQPSKSAGSHADQ